jgi:hypothetical protein
MKECLNPLRDFFRNDLVLFPFFSNTKEDRRALIVAIRVATSTVDLFDREREADSKFLTVRSYYI